MPTLQEIELRAQLARRDERILELEKQLEKQTFRAAPIRADMTQIKERPILFSAEMVRAILGGRIGRVASVVV